MARKEYLSEVLTKGQRITFSKLRPLQKILFVRTTNNAIRVQRAWRGQVVEVDRNGRQTFVIETDTFWSQGAPSDKYQPKTEKFQYTGNDTLYVLEDIVQQSKEEFIKQRKAYAEARRTLSSARSVADDAFSLLGVTSRVTAEEFKPIKRKLMLKYHPDICQDTELSKKYTDAISFVSQFVQNRDNRIK